MLGIRKGMFIGGDYEGHPSHIPGRLKNVSLKTTIHISV